MRKVSQYQGVSESATHQIHYLADDFTNLHANDNAIKNMKSVDDCTVNTEIENMATTIYASRGLQERFHEITLLELYCHHHKELRSQN